MNRSSIACTALALAVALYASDGRAQQRPPSPSTSTQPGGTITAESFVQEVAEDYQKEIEVSRLASTRAQSKDVRDYAKQLVDDHTNGLEKLRKYASGKSITLRTAAGTTTDRPVSTYGAPAGHNEPTPGGKPGHEDLPQPGQAGREPSTSRPSSSGAYGEGASAQMRELNAKSGAEFDKAYVQMMVDDHQKAVSLFERQHDAKLGDSELQSFISDQQGTLKKHLNKAKDIQKDLQKDADRDTSKTSAPSTKPLPSGAPAGGPTR